MTASHLSTYYYCVRCMTEATGPEGREREGGDTETEGERGRERQSEREIEVERDRARGGEMERGR